MRGLDFSSFVGGQGENQCEGGFLNGGKVYRGDIRSIAVVDGDLKISYDWLAVMTSPAEGWVADLDSTHLEFSLSMTLFAAPQPDEYGRLIIDASFVEQLLVLFPKNYAPHGELKRLDRSRVRGLVA